MESIAVEMTVAYPRSVSHSLAPFEHFRAIKYPTHFPIILKFQGRSRTSKGFRTMAMEILRSLSRNKEATSSLSFTVAVYEIHTCS
jgi:hypothetical protein